MCLYRFWWYFILGKRNVYIENIMEIFYVQGNKIGSQYSTRKVARGMNICEEKYHIEKLEHFIKMVLREITERR
jgi:hypothetical protein